MYHDIILINPLQCTIINKIYIKLKEKSFGIGQSKAYLFLWTNIFILLSF